MTAPLADQRLAEVEQFLDVWDAAPAHRAGYRDVISSQKSGGDGRKLRASTLRALIAEVRRLRDDRNHLARAFADANDALLDTDAACVRLGNDLGARDAELAALQVEHEDLQAAYDRLGDQAQRIVEAASRFRSDRDRLHDALSGLLLGPVGAGWESSGAGDVRSPWIPAERVAGWRQVLAGTERSERDGDAISETDQNGPVAPTGESRSPVDAQGGEVAQRGAVRRDGHTQADTDRVHRAEIARALHEYADKLDAVPLDCTALTGPVWYGQGWRDAVNHLRDLADGLMPAPIAGDGSEP